MNEFECLIWNLDKAEGEKPDDQITLPFAPFAGLLIRTDEVELKVIEVTWNKG